MLALAVAACGMPWQSDAAGRRDYGLGRFDPMDADAVATAGDRVTYAIDYDDGSRPRRWLLELSLPEKPLLEHYVTQNGADWASGFRRTPDSLWGDLTDPQTKQRLVRYCNSETPLRVRLLRQHTGEELTQVVTTQIQTHVWQEAVDTLPEFGLTSLFNALVDSQCLFDELAAVAQAPSIASVIGKGMRVSVSIELQSDPRPEVRTVDTPFGPLPAFWLPVTILANDQPALLCRVLVTWKRSPLLPCFGVLRIEGQHPGDPTRCFRVTLLGAERGVRDPVIDRGDLGAPGLRVGMTEAELLAALGGAVDRRFRVRLPDGTAVELVSVDRPPHLDDRVGAFIDGRLVYCQWPGIVVRYLEQRGLPPGGVYKQENRVQ